MDFHPPICDLSNPADVEAWFGNYGYADHYRKIVLAQCRELVRSGSALQGVKLSEAKIDDLARLQDNYLDFLAKCLEGRRQREENLRQAIGV